MADVEIIMAQAESLPLGQRMYLADRLRASLDRDVHNLNAKDRYLILLPIAESATGYDMVTRRRSRRDVEIRSLIAKQMREEGYTFDAIGHVMGKNHSTVYNCVNRLEDALAAPSYYPEEVAHYKEFHRLLAIADGKAENTEQHD